MRSGVPEERARRGSRAVLRRAVMTVLWAVVITGWPAVSIAMGFLPAADGALLCHAGAAITALCGLGALRARLAVLRQVDEHERKLRAQDDAQQAYADALRTAFRHAGEPTPPGVRVLYAVPSDEAARRDAPALQKSAGRA